MSLDDGDLVRLARIERQLEREDPELVETLLRWSPAEARSRVWAGRLTVAAGAVFAAIALLLGNVGWLLLAVVTSAAGWFLLRTAPGKLLLLGRRTDHEQ
jgi:hypothetical protein